VIRPRWRKVVFDLWSNRPRSVLVVSSILVGLFAIGVISSLFVLVASDMRTGYAATNPANIFINTSLFEKGLINRLERIPGVRQVEGARSVSLRIQAGPDEWSNIQVVAIPDYEGMQVNQVDPVAGGWPPGERQIVVEQTKLDRAHADLGDLVTLELPTGEKRQLELVGLVKDQSLGAGGSGSGGFFNAPIRGYVSRETLEWLKMPLPGRLNTLHLTVMGNHEDTAYMEGVTILVTDELKKNGVEVYSSSVRSSFDHPNRDLMQAIVGVLLVLGMLVVFLSGFLITNTLQALLEQQVQQVGIMKSIGARRLQIVNIYMVMILIYGVIAFLIAVPLSARVTGFLLEFLATQVNYATPGERLVPGVVLLQAILALLVPQIAASLPIWKGTGISVQEALSGIRQSRSRPAKSTSSRVGTHSRLSRPIRISIRNVFRRKGRLVLTLVTLTMGGAIFIATFSVRVSMQNYIDQIGRYFLADVNVALARPYRLSEIKRILHAIPDVRYVEAWSSARTQMLLPDGSEGEEVQMLAPPASSPLVIPVLIEGRWLQPGDQNAIVLNELFQSRFPDLEVGDTLRLKVNGDETDWTVVGFYLFAGKVTGFLAYTDYDYLTRLTGQMNQALLYRVVIDSPQATPEMQLALAQAIEARLRENLISVADVTTGASLVDRASGGFGILTSFLLFLASLIALVGSIGLTGTMSMNVLERTREIGILRAIGATNIVLMKMVVVEGVLIGLLSWLMAALLSFPIGKLISDSITLSVFGSPSQPGFPPAGFLIWLAVVITLSILASVMPARNAASLTIREVLSYE
jgi:putative ABC transport system permease protein